MIFPEEKEKWLCTTLELLKLMQIFGYVQIAANIKLKVSFPYQAKMLRHNIYIIEKKYLDQRTRSMQALDLLSLFKVISR